LPEGLVVGGINPGKLFAQGRRKTGTNGKQLKKKSGCLNFESAASERQERKSSALAREN
jgi:hypothetical protein